ncbi:MAG: cobalamin-independent methionine synthase II family protein [Streptosporangiaceae bacterium]
MQRSTDRVLTTHVGSLPRPEELLEFDRNQWSGRGHDEREYASRLRAAVHDVVRREADAGVDIAGDGEYGKAARGQVDYGAWMTYIYNRLGGWETRRPDAPGLEPQESGTLVARRLDLTDRKDWTAFADFYREEVVPDLMPPIESETAPVPMATTFTGPVSYRGHEALRRDIDDLEGALEGVDVAEAFMTSVSPESVGRGQNRHYPDEEEFLFAIADAMHEEYKAIVDAGFVLQIDDPGLAENWDAVADSVDVEQYRRFANVTVDALNHALRGLPEDRVRYHMCWGSWHGPHVHDLPLTDIVDVMLRVNAGAYLVEAGNVRHEHDWKVWRDTKLPDGKILIPGVVSHATNVVEHPEVVADRIVRYAETVGRDNVIAGSDCGLGGRIHPSLVWAKLDALAQGAALASQRLWR